MSKKYFENNAKNTTPTTKKRITTVEEAQATADNFAKLVAQYQEENALKRKEENARRVDAINNGILGQYLSFSTAKEGETGMTHGVKVAGATAVDAVSNILSGAVSGFENLAQAGINVGLNTLSTLGLANETDVRQAKDEVARNLGEGGMDVALENFGDTVGGDYSLLNAEKSNAVTQGIGNTLFQAYMTNGLGLGEIPLKFAGQVINMPVSSIISGMASGEIKADSRNAKGWQALAESLIQGGAEGISEGFFGIAGVGGSSVEDRLQETINKYVTNKIGNAFAQLGLNSAGEGAEEILSYVMTYAGEHILDLFSKNGVMMGDEFDLNEMIDSAISAGLSAGLQGTGSVAKAIATNRNMATGYTAEESEQLETFLSNAEKRMNENNTGTTRAEMNEVKDKIRDKFKEGVRNQEELDTFVDAFKSARQAEIDDNTFKNVSERLEKDESFRKAYTEGITDGLRSTNRAEQRHAKELNERIILGTAEKVGADMKQAKSVARVANTLGISVQDMDGEYEGAQDSKGVYINKDTTNPVHQVIKHEINHFIHENGNKKTVRDFDMTMLELAIEKGYKLNNIANNLSAQEAYKNLSPTELVEEITSIMTQTDIFEDVQTIDDLVRLNRSTAENIKNRISELYNTFTGKTEKALMQKAERLYAKALQQNEGRARQAFASSGNNINELNESYNDAISKNDMRSAEQIVEEFAKAKGYPRAGVHGTIRGDFTKFDKHYADAEGNSGAGFYFSTSEDDSDNNYANLNGADVSGKIERLAEKIQQEREDEGEDISYEDAKELAIEQLNKGSRIYNVYLKTDNPYTRNYGKSTNLYNEIYDSVDESLVDRDDYDTDEEYEEALSEETYNQIYDYISDKVNEAVRLVEENFEIYDYSFVESAISDIYSHAISYESLDWDDVNRVFSDLTVELEDSSGDYKFGNTELTRAFIEAMGYDSIVDEEVSSKFRGMDIGDGEQHIIVFHPEQIKSADPVTYDDNGNPISLEERFDSNNDDIRYSSGNSISDLNEDSEYNNREDIEDEFRRLQAESERVLAEGNWGDKSRELDEPLQRRLSAVFTRILESSRDGNGNAYGRLDLGENAKFTVYKDVDGKTFHDIFSIVRTYLPKGELVDLHPIVTEYDGDYENTGYNDTRNFISSDGLSGFAIKKNGNLISVFNGANKRGFLKEVSTFIKENASSLDCYVLDKKFTGTNLLELYKKRFGFEVEELVDYDMEYDHDKIAERYEKPTIAYLYNPNYKGERKSAGNNIEALRKAVEIATPIVRDTKEAWDLRDSINSATEHKYPDLGYTKYIKTDSGIAYYDVDYITGQETTTPVEYVYRAVSKAEMEYILKNGYIKSNQSMNIGDEVEQGLTVYSGTHAPTFYLPEDGGYMLKIKTTPDMNWDKRDSYVKTPNKVPAENIVEINGKPVSNTTRFSAGNNIEQLNNEVSSLRGQIDDLQKQYEEAYNNDDNVNKGRLFRELNDKIEEYIGYVDDNYMNAVANGDMETASKLLENYADFNGFNTPDLFHGTRKFGFTKFDLEKMDDKISIFTTSDLGTAKTYSKGADVRNISDKGFMNMSDSEMLNYLNENSGRKYVDVLTVDEVKEQIKSFISEAKNEIAKIAQLEKDVTGSKTYARTLGNLLSLFEGDNATAMDIYDYIDESILGSGRYSENLYDNYANLQKIIADISNASGAIKRSEGKSIFHGTYKRGSSRNGYVSRSDIENKYGTNGTYRLKGKTDNMLSVDAEGRNWSSIYFNGRFYNTRDLSLYAKNNGYDGVIIKSVVDDGGTNGFYGEAGDVYIYFDPSSLKSMDTVTYDDEGNVIPLSQRFQYGNEDFRFSAGNNIEDLNFQQRFSDTPVADESNTDLGNINSVLNDANFDSIVANKSNMYKRDFRTPDDNPYADIQNNFRSLEQNAPDTDTGYAGFVEEDIDVLQERMARMNEEMRQNAQYTYGEQAVDTNPYRRDDRTAQQIMEGEDVAKIADEYVSTPRDSKEYSKVAKRMFMKNFVDHGYAIRELTDNMRKLFKKGTKMSNLADKIDADYDAYLRADAMAQNVIGNQRTDLKSGKKIGESLQAIWSDVEKAGLKKQMSEYLYHYLNLDSMTLQDRGYGINKPVFGYKVTAQVSQQMIDALDKAHPELKALAERMWEYEKQDAKMLDDAGFTDKDSRALMTEMYPHYIPVLRQKVNEADMAQSEYNTANKAIKRRTGANYTLMNAQIAMATHTQNVFKSIAKNELFKDIAEGMSANTESSLTAEDGEFVTKNIAQANMIESMDGMPAKFIFYKDGISHTYNVSQDMYDAMMKRSSIVADTPLGNVLGKVTNLRKNLITSYNPTFILKNAIKDIQDAPANTKFAKTYAKNVAEAVAQMSNNGEKWQWYKSLGGSQDSYFNYEKEFKKDAKTPIGKAMNRVVQANELVEMMPRFAEFLNCIENGMTPTEAMLASAEITTNFKRGGDISKELDRAFVPFLNASIQGAYRQMNNAKDAGRSGAKGVLAYLMKMTLIYGLPLGVAGAIWDDDEDYEELSDYIKQNYYIVGKTKDGKFIRIPKGRIAVGWQNMMSNAYEFGKDIFSGEKSTEELLDTIIKDVWDDGKVMFENVGINNPITNNLASPIVDVLNNRTWYGDQLIPTRLENVPDAEQYDESTDSLSKLIGERTNTSPYKINYLLDQYGGALGDVFLPMMTPKAENGVDGVLGNLLAPLTSPFVADPVTSNQNVSDFYDMKTELQKLSNSENAKDEQILAYKYMSKVGSEMSELYKQKRDIQNDPYLKDSEKYAQTRELQRQIDELAKQALNNYDNMDISGDYANIAGVEYYKKDDSWTKITDATLERMEGLSTTEKGAFISATNAINRMVDDGELKGDDKKRAVADVISGYDISNELKGKMFSKYYDSNTTKMALAFDTDVDEFMNYYAQTFEGKNKKQDTFNYISSMNISEIQKAVLFKMAYSSYKQYDQQIVDYIVNLERSREEREELLKMVGFEIDENGNIYRKA